MPRRELVTAGRLSPFWRLATLRGRFWWRKRPRLLVATRSLPALIFGNISPKSVKQLLAIELRKLIVFCSISHAVNLSLGNKARHYVCKYIIPYRHI